jgi:hypothetical protein
MRSNRSFYYTPLVTFYEDVMLPFLLKFSPYSLVYTDDYIVIRKAFAKFLNTVRYIKRRIEYE